MLNFEIRLCLRFISYCCKGSFNESNSSEFVIVRLPLALRPVVMHVGDIALKPPALSSSSRLMFKSRSDYRGISSLIISDIFSSLLCETVGSILVWRLLATLGILGDEFRSGVSRWLRRALASRCIILLFSPRCTSE